MKMGLSLHKDYAVVTPTDTVMDRCISCWQIGKDEVKVSVKDSQDNSFLTVTYRAATSAGSVLLVGQDVSRDDEDGHFRGQLRINHIAVALESHVRWT
eukprot:g34850.t1